MGKGADGPRGNARGAAQGDAHVGEVAAHAGAVDEGAGGRRLAVGRTRLVVDLGLDPIEDLQHPVAADRAAEGAFREPAELVGRAVAAGVEIGQDVGGQIAPVVLDRHRRQTLEHAVVDDGLIGQRHLARQVSAQGAGPELLVLVFDEGDRGRGCQAFLDHRLARPVGDLNLVDGVRRRIEAINEIGTDKDFHRLSTEAARTCRQRRGSARVP